MYACMHARALAFTLVPYENHTVGPASGSGFLQYGHFDFVLANS